MDKYVYKGPVLYFGKYVGNWRGETFAESAAKAKSNLLFQYKQHMNLAPSAGGISLPNKVIKEERMYA